MLLHVGGDLPARCRPTSNIVAWIDWGDSVAGRRADRADRSRADPDPDTRNDPEIPQSVIALRLPSSRLFPRDNQGRPVVRTFPRTTRARALAALLVRQPAARGRRGAAASPLGRDADDLKDKKHKVEQKIAGAHEDLDESSAQLAQRDGRAAAPRKVQLDAAQAHLAADPRPARRRRGPRQADAGQARRRGRPARSRPARTSPPAGRRSPTSRSTLGQIVVAELPDRRPVPDGPVDGAHLAGPRPADRPAELRAERHRQGVGRPRPARGVQGPAHRAGAGGRGRQGRGGQGAQGGGREPGAQAGARGAGRGRRAAGLEPRRRCAPTPSRRPTKATRGRPRPAARPAEGAQPDRGDPQKRAEEARRRAAAAAAPARPAARSSATAARSHSNGFLDYPVAGPVTSPFGWRIHPIYGYRSLHDGVDFGAACGTPIHAAAAGTVRRAVLPDRLGQPGDHRPRLPPRRRRSPRSPTTCQPATSSASVSTSQRGQVVGYVGTTGWSTGCHLHFTVMQNGTPVTR